MMVSQTIVCKTENVTAIIQSQLLITNEFHLWKLCSLAWKNDELMQLLSNMHEETSALVLSTAYIKYNAMKNW